MENEQDLKEFLFQETKKLIERRNVGDNVQYIIDRLIHALDNYEEVNLLKASIDRAKRED